MVFIFYILNVFRRLSLCDIYDQRIKAPFVPELDSAGDTTNFDDYDEAPLLHKNSDDYPEKFIDFPLS